MSYTGSIHRGRFFNCCPARSASPRLPPGKSGASHQLAGPSLRQRLSPNWLMSYTGSIHRELFLNCCPCRHCFCPATTGQIGPLTQAGWTISLPETKSELVNELHRVHTPRAFSQLLPPPAVLLRGYHRANQAPHTRWLDQSLCQRRNPNWLMSYTGSIHRGVWPNCCPCPQCFFTATTGQIGCLAPAGWTVSLPRDQVPTG